MLHILDESWKVKAIIYVTSKKIIVMLYNDNMGIRYNKNKYNLVTFMKSTLKKSKVKSNVSKVYCCRFTN